jgi:hypothetical protein
MRGTRGFLWAGSGGAQLGEWSCRAGGPCRQPGRTTNTTSPQPPRLASSASVHLYLTGIEAVVGQLIFTLSQSRFWAVL